MKPGYAIQQEERKLQRTMALELAKPYCQQNGYSFAKLQKQRFFLIGGNVWFAQPSDVIPDGLRNDIATQPIPTLQMRQIDGKIVFETTEHTEKYLKE